jgi:hypothetical protein
MANLSKCLREIIGCVAVVFDNQEAHVERADPGSGSRLLEAHFSRIRRQEESPRKRGTDSLPVWNSARQAQVWSSGFRRLLLQD